MYFYICALFVFYFSTISAEPGVENYAMIHQAPFPVGGICGPGYERDPRNHNKCRPVCKQPCTEGKCVAPDRCECFTERVMSLGGNCVSKCPHSCLNGDCVPHCDASGCRSQCMCKPGYQLHPSGDFCVPLCSQPCNYPLNCTAPNVCGCGHGSKLNPYTNQCEAICEPPCGNGRCVAPGQCECNHGYQIKDGTCQANCTRCMYGRCVAHEDCRCDDGWVLRRDLGRCEPVCSKGCEGGICVAPEKCQCEAGYTLQQDIKCKPVCKRCLNGICVAPGICQCKPGYVRSFSGCKRDRDSNKNVVIYNPPSYNPPPVNQVPIYPVYDPKTSYPTQPRCDVNCLNGYCIGYNQCQCNNGYSYQGGQYYECKPICNPPCFNGTCIQPNKCDCYPGFTLINEKCQPQRHATTYRPPQQQIRCDVSCRNGHCVGYNQCQCNAGYANYGSQYYDCKPLCNPPCVNGICTSPNYCICNAGFVKERGSNYACVPN